MSRLADLFGVFALLSVMAVGGGVAVLPEMKRLVVEQHGWMTAGQFVDVYGVGQLAPGPNMLMVMVIGYHVAGMLGALVVGVGFFLPSSVLTFGANRLWHRFEGSPWRGAVQRGLAPLTIGLMLSGVVTLAKVALVGWAQIALATAVLVILLARHVNPGLLILAAAALGWLVGRPG